MLLNRRRGTILEHEASSGLPACHRSDKDESQVHTPLLESLGESRFGCLVA
jgi:hypothetical protein